MQVSLQQSILEKEVGQTQRSFALHLKEIERRVTNAYDLRRQERIVRLDCRYYL